MNHNLVGGCPTELGSPLCVWVCDIVIRFAIFFTFSISAFHLSDRLCSRVHDCIPSCDINQLKYLQIDSLS